MNQASIAFHDANCTLGRFPNHGCGVATIEGLAKSLGELGITRALIRHALGHQTSSREANAALAEATAGDAHWTPCWTLNPAQMPDGLVGHEPGEVRTVCLYPKLHGYPLCDWMVRDSIAPLAERGVLALVEADQVTLPDLHAFCQAFPSLRVIVLNTGYRVLGPLSRMLATCPNLYVELATLATYRGIETLTQRHGAERLLFGTNTPLSDGIGVVAALSHADVSEEERTLIAGDNLSRLLAEVRP